MTKTSTLHRALAVLFLAGMTAAPILAGCGSSLASRCKTICENFAKCGTATQCNCDSNTSCSNASEIVDYLESCSAKPCNEQFALMGTTPSGCLTTVPACKK